MRPAWPRANAGLIAALAACSDPVIQMELALPDPTATGAPDLSCAGAVRVDVVGNNPGDARDAERVATCFDFMGPPLSFGDVAAALAGKFTFDVPRDGLAGVQLTGFAGRCADPGTFESVFYGGAPNLDGSSLVIPLKLGVGCGTQQSYLVQTLDLTALYQPNGPSCAQPGDAVTLFAGVIRPRMLGDKAPATVFEYGASSLETSTGMGTLQSFRPNDGDPACVALGYRGAASGGLTCVRPPAQARGICGGAGVVEIVAVPVTALAALDPGLVAAYGNPLVGAVWDASTRQSIQGATVELADPTQGKVVYVDISIESGVSPPRLRKMVPVPGATATAPGGGFIVYLRGTATNLIVRAPGHVPQTLRIATAPDQLSTMIVAMP